MKQFSIDNCFSKFGYNYFHEIRVDIALDLKNLKQYLINYPQSELCRQPPVERSPRSNPNGEKEFT